MGDSGSVVYAEMCRNGPHINKSSPILAFVQNRSKRAYVNERIKKESGIEMGGGGGGGWVERRGREEACVSLYGPSILYNNVIYCILFWESNHVHDSRTHAINVQQTIFYGNDSKV